MQDQRARTAWIFSLTPVTDEPRVRRQAQALSDQGWRVVVFGFPGRTRKPDPWVLFQIVRQGHFAVSLVEYKSSGVPAATIVAPQGTLRKIVKYLLGELNIVSLPFMLLSRWCDRAAVAAYWTQPFNCALFRQACALLRDRPDLRPDLVIGHDYYTAPLASRIAAWAGVLYSIDVHEYAREQFLHKPVWRLIFQPWVDRLQKIYLGKSAGNTIVCAGIAELLTRDYPAIAPSIVIRSVAPYIKMDASVPSQPVRVLYHGVVNHARGLTHAIESMPFWQNDYQFIIRGHGPAEYIQSLKDRARDLGLSDRVVFEPPVLFHDIIPAANKCDIGYFVQEDISLQKRFALPNKFFEYITAGVALCVSDLPEMARLMRQYDLGHMVHGVDRHAIADAINRFDRDSIVVFKKNALAAAQDLCWEKESIRMMDLYNTILSRPGQGAS